MLIKSPVEMSTSELKQAIEDDKIPEEKYDDYIDEMRLRIEYAGCYAGQRYAHFGLIRVH